MATESSEQQTPESPPPTGSLAHDIDKRNNAYASAVAHEIKGFFSSFQAAVTVLRIAYSYGELDESVEQKKGSLAAFFDRLKIIEQSLYEKPSVKSFVVVVEGLDGTGKSTLVETLAKEQNDPFRGMALATPTASMDAVRPVFDKRGGPVARAFYMVSNYILQHEIRVECERNPLTVFVVDRWYSSTCAYSIAWKNTRGGPESIDGLDKYLFQWPRDLDPPQLMLLLRVDNETRLQRVSGRNKANDFNPWDKRLSQDDNLGKRIMRCHERIVGPRAVVDVNANKSRTEVAQEALNVVHRHAMCHFQPWNYFKYQPLEFFRWASSELGLCDSETGKRSKHAPWAFQLALNTHNGGCPSLRTVGIHTVDSAGILFFTCPEPAGGLGGTGVTRDFASMVCVQGDYPNEQQWRAEGILCSTTLEECDVMNTQPPDSLVAQLTACDLEQKEDKQEHKGNQRRAYCESHGETVQRVRQNPLPREEQKRFVKPTRFVPMRMEVLIGGPSSPGGPRRYEWWRKGDKDHNGWNEAKQIMPFSPPGAIACPIASTVIKPITLAITGTHCAGKRTLGERLARILGWKFDAELGEILRDAKDIIVDAHKAGYGSGVDASGDKMEWDDRLYYEECNRDKGNYDSRVVETWHLGNLAWAFLRNDGLKSKQPEVKGKLMQMAHDAIEAELKRSCVLLVHLETSAETTIRRRKLPENSARVPMAHEEAECASLHQDLQLRGQVLLSQFKDLDIPVFVFNNDADGDEAVEASIRKIIQFVNLNQWRTLDRKSEKD